MTDSPYKLLVLIPAYNAAGYLSELVMRIRKSSPVSDILIIDDGSTDDTAEIAHHLDAVLITNDNNRGKGYSLQRGFDYAVGHEYDFVVTIDADLQHLPEEIPLFVNGICSAAVYIGTRRIALDIMPFARWLTNNLTSLIISVFGGQRTRDSQSGFRMFSKDALKRMKAQSNRYDFESELLFQTGLLGMKVAEVPISTVYEESVSFINPFKDTGRFIRQIWKRIML